MKRAGHDAGDDFADNRVPAETKGSEELDQRAGIRQRHAAQPTLRGRQQPADGGAPGSSLKDWARRIRKRTSHKKACVALARKLAVILHRMLITGEAFRWPEKEAATTA